MRRPTLTPQSVALVLGAGLVLLGVAGFIGVYDWVVDGEDLAAADQGILDALVGWRRAPATLVLLAVTTVSGPVALPVLVLIGALVWGLRAGQWWSAGLLVGAMLAATGVTVVIKALVGRPRPAEDLWVIPGAESSASFPSGHTIGAATFLLVLGYLAWVRRPGWRPALRWLLGAAAGMGLVALSRMYLGYHFATDTLAAMALAVAVLGVVVVVDRRRAGPALASVARSGRTDGRPRQDSNLRPTD